VRVQELEVQPAKRRRIQTDEARAKAIARQAEKKASERKAMSISLPEVPEWVGGLVEPEMEVCSIPIKIPATVLVSFFETLTNYRLRDFWPRLHIRLVFFKARPRLRPIRWEGATQVSQIPQVR
jgi:hypothetical protein